jgi:excisionase family DNA binding protein
MQLHDSGQKIGAATGRLAYTVEGVCETAGIGRSSVFEAIRSGELVARKMGRRTIVLEGDLRRWLASLPRAVDAA